MEPTGHYGECLQAYLEANGLEVVMVNPASVKKAKELDDNSPRKSDEKDPRTIAKLVIDGRFMYPGKPEGVYGTLRELGGQLAHKDKTICAEKNRLSRWIYRFFPECLTVYDDLTAVGLQLILKQAPFPEDIVKLGVKGVMSIWTEGKYRRRKEDKAKELVQAATNSVGIAGNEVAKVELLDIYETLEVVEKQKRKIVASMEQAIKEVPNAEKLLEIPGLGSTTVGVMLGEMGDITRFKNPKQVQKYAGLEPTSDSSGKHQGETHISKRGRKRLRKTMFHVGMSMIAHSAACKELHTYYTTRNKNPLKKMQSVITVACKMLRVIFKILKDGVPYDEAKMMTDIHRQTA